MATSGQKLIGRNRAPRVQIEYDTELYRADKVPELPFVMGVMSDLSGKSEEPLAPVTERKFVDIDADTFDDKLKAMKPRVAFPVKNVLTEGGDNLMVDITFESMADFSPEAVARKVDGVKELFEARKQLETLLANLDGKADAVKRLTEAINNPAVLQALASAKPAEAGGDAGTSDAPAETPSEGEE